MLSLFHLPEASTFAGNIDLLYDYLFWFSLISFALVIGLMIFFTIRFSRKRIDPDKTPYIIGHTATEMFVSIFLFIVVMVVFYWGWIDYSKMYKAPADAIEINVLAKQWLWEFEYANGRKMLNKIVVPEGKPVKLIMTSADVLHSFYVPNFRIKQDVIPNRYTSVWFNATLTGDHQVFCAEYCGTAHSQMLGKVTVVPAEEYQRWQTLWEVEQSLGIEASQALEPSGDQASPPAETLASRGGKVFSEKGCMACHSVTGQTIVGPTLKGVFGHEVELTNGDKVSADENYIRESIMNPQTKLVKGFPPVMPTYAGTLTDDEINALVAYIKSLGK